jgi:hypothetical protein
MKCIVRAKSGTNFERETMRSRKMILETGTRSQRQCLDKKKGMVEFPHQRKLFNIHTRPSIHPIVVSPRKLFQLKMRSREKTVPATRVVKRMRAVAQT